MVYKTTITCMHVINYNTSHGCSPDIRSIIGSLVWWLPLMVTVQVIVPASSAVTSSSVTLCVVRPCGKQLGLPLLKLGLV